MSRVGYLRLPMPTDASAPAQADAHVCLLNALGIGRAAVMDSHSIFSQQVRAVLVVPAQPSKLYNPPNLAKKPLVLHQICRQLNANKRKQLLKPEHPACPTDSTASSVRCSRRR